MLGIAIVGLIAAFMAGVAANVTAFNTVVTYDLLQDYIWKDRDPAFYLRWGRLVTIAGVVEVGQRRGGGSAPFPLTPSRTRREPFSSPGSPAAMS